MRILVTGSRNWNDSAAIREAIAQACRDLSDRVAPVTVVHGGAVGADRIAGRIAAAYGFTIECHPADWLTYGKRAGFVRNSEMVNAGADVCLAFIRNQSRGATMCADLAEKAGIPTQRVTA